MEPDLHMLEELSTPPQFFHFKLPKNTLDIPQYYSSEERDTVIATKMLC